MNKDEILAKSREENKSSDERQLFYQRKAGAISGCVGLVLCAVIALFEGIFGDSVVLFYGCFSIYWGIIASNHLVMAIATKRKYIWLAVIAVVMFLGFTIKLLEELI